MSAELAHAERGKYYFIVLVFLRTHLPSCALWTADIDSADPGCRPGVRSMPDTTLFLRLVRSAEPILRDEA